MTLIRFLFLFSIFPLFGETKNMTLDVKNILGEDTKMIRTTSESAIFVSNHWLDQAFSALFAAVATETIPVVSWLERKNHEKCAKNVVDLQDHAKCVSDLIDKARKTEIRNSRIKKMLVKIQKLRKNDKNWMGSFRIRKKRQMIQNRSEYKLKSKNDVSTFTKIAKQITKSVRALKNKKDNRSWHQIMSDIKKLERNIEKQKEMEKMLRRSVNSRKLKGEEKSLKLNKLQTEKDELRSMKFVRNAVKLGLSIFGQNVTGFDEKNLKFISPRFFSVVPDEKNSNTSEVNVLSPSLFSLHDEGEAEEKTFSLPNLLAEKMPSFGRGRGGEKDAIMDLLTEITGISETVDEAAKKISKQSEGVLMNSKGEQIQMSRENLTRIYGKENYRKMKILEKLHGMYTEEQLQQFNKSGYSIMTNDQRTLFYGDGSPFANAETLRAAENLTIPKARRALKTMVREFGKGNIKLEKFNKRMKDIVMSPILFTNILKSPEMASQALVLSPVLFSPLVLSPSIFGSVILSPWVFVPVILSPRLMAPIIVSPAIFSPIILSPLALDPLVLVPGVANPIVLSPFVLTPFILSPQVLTPIILSPSVLSPFVLTPSVASPFILSPFALSPIILSPAYMSGIFFSPYFLSPIIASPAKMFSIVASPSFLS